MQRWQHAGRGPKSALFVGILFGMASLMLFQLATAYGVEPPYPGPPGLPGIPNGPSIGCTPSGSDAATWVCGFDVGTTITFKVNGHNAGTDSADANGCILVVLSFSKGQVSVNGNAPVNVKHGLNHLIVEGSKTTNGVKQTVGLRLPFSTPKQGSNSCQGKSSPPVTTTTGGPSNGTTTTIRGRLTTTTLPIVTTSHPFYPTTLAKVIETPLQISPNRVILESSLLAAVLAAVLSAGALGAIWAAGERGPGSDGGAPQGEGDGAPGGGSGGEGVGEAAAPASDPTGLGFAAGAGAGAGAGASGATGAPGSPSAFSRPDSSPPTPGGGGA